MSYGAYPGLHAGIRQLFEEHPVICGFTINRDGGVLLDCWPRESASAALRAQVLQRLLELVEGRGDAAAWLFGRTFARILH
jgi:hypothetical protein